MGFAAGIALGLISYRKHRSIPVVLFNGVSTAIFLAALMSIGSIVGQLDESEAWKLEALRVNQFDLRAGSHSSGGLVWMENMNREKEE